MTNRFRLAAALLLTTGCASLQPGESTRIVADMADLATTYYAIDQCGSREVVWGFVNDDAGTVVVTAGVAKLMHHLWTRRLLRGHPADQKKIWRILAGVSFGFAGWNTVQIAEADCGGRR